MAEEEHTNQKKEGSPGSAYVRIMGNAWLAKQYGELEEISPQSYFGRAFLVMEINLKNAAVRRRH